MLLSTAIFVLALAVNQAPALQFTPDYAENIDNKDAWNARIVSGWQARPGQYPHMVSLRMVNRAGTVQACGGNVISRQWILTAAHCTATQVTLVVRAGVTNLTRPEFMTETQEYYIYPTFNAANPQFVQPNDISVVKLPISLSYSQNLKPIRIQSSADAHRNYENLITLASGFGRTWTNGPQTEHLHWVYLRGVSNAACANIFTSTFVTDNTVCARFFNVTSQSICQGDSGGPLIHISAQDEPILIGVSSFVAAEPHGCHSGLPAAFIRPGPFHLWYTQITGIDFENLKEEDETTTSSPLPTTTTSSTFAPSATTTQRPTSTTTITTVTVPATTVTTSSPLPTTTTSSTFAPSTTTTQRPTSTTTITTVTVPATTVTTSSPLPTTTTSSTFAPSTTTTQRPTSTTTITTVTVPATTVTTSSQLPTIATSNTFAPSTTTTQRPTSTTTIPTVTVPATTVITSAPSTTTPAANTTSPNPEEEDIDDPELEELLKRLEIKVKVKVRLSKYLKKKKQITH